MDFEQLPATPSELGRSDRQPDEYRPMQTVTRQIAFENGWDAERKAKIQELFDGMAPEWGRIGAGREAPLRDALARSGAAGGGTCVEVGSGTGMQTPPLAEHYDSVVSVDLAPAMLGLTVRAGAVSLVRADASLLPFADESVAAVAAVNMFLFPGEYARVLKPGGHLVFVSTSGEQTPIYLPIPEVVAAMTSALGGTGSAVASQHGFATWTVVTKGAR